MSMVDWAREEVDRLIADQKERDPEDYKYLANCAEGAYQAYKVLCNQGYSGFSIEVTKQILDYLIDARPLTPVLDDPEEWNDISGKGTVVMYQSKRMSSLFKYVDTRDGREWYSDIDRVAKVLRDGKGGTSSWHSAFITRMVDDLFPITMPYLPEKKNSYRVYCSEFAYEKHEAADYSDTLGVHILQRPDGTQIEINRYFKDSPDGVWIEIEKGEYMARAARRRKDDEEG